MYLPKVNVTVYQPVCSSVLEVKDAVISNPHGPQDRKKEAAVVQLVPGRSIAFASTIAGEPITFSAGKRLS